MDHIKPFDPSDNPLRDINEVPRLLQWYVDDHQLEVTAKRIWNSLKDSFDVRRALLRHLFDQVVDNSAQSRRFIELRTRGLVEAHGDSDTFAENICDKDWAGIEWPELQRYIALYAESQGEDGPHFSSGAFYLHYLEAHNQPLPG